MTLIYLVHADGRFVVCCTERCAAPYAAQGYQRCDWATLRAAWRADDRRRAFAQ